MTASVENGNRISSLHLIRATHERFQSP